MANYIAVNKTGSSVTVRNSIGGTSIGTILNREVFGIVGMSEGSTAAIRFRNGSGQVVNGYIDSADVNYNGALYTPISDYPHSTNDFYDNGTQVYFKGVIFQVRNNLTVYNSSGGVWGSVAAGQQVAAKQSYEAQNGQNNPDWLQINYVRSSSGTWTQINNAFGFVPMGLNIGSTYSNVPVYGSW
jgi:hypothetical protein